MVRIRRARPDEAGALSELALQSKAHWGYDPRFLEACREDPTLSPEALREIGFERLLIEAEPNAEAFYRAMGAERVGERESSVQRGRFLPLLKIYL